MTAPHHFEALAISFFLIVLPLTGSAETVMGNQLLSPPANKIQLEKAPRNNSQALSFDWMANGSPIKSSDNRKAVKARYRVITGKGSWICSPAGFGQRSRCYAG